MSKWGVRLIGVGFLVWAAINVYSLIRNPGYSGGFPVIHLYLYTYNGIGQVDLMGWIGVAILCYIGFYLIRFNRKGRTWALIILWPNAIIFTVAMIATCVSFFSQPVLQYLSHSIFSSYTWQSLSEQYDTSVKLMYLFGMAFLLSVVPLYYLLRKDTKSLFQKNTPIGETA